MAAKTAKKVKKPGKNQSPSGLKVRRPEKESVEDRFFRVVQGMEKRLEKRISELENKFFAFQCGAQAQMERDRQAMAFERLASEKPLEQAPREEPEVLGE